MVVLADSHDCATQGHEDENGDFRCDHCNNEFGYRLKLEAVDEGGKSITGAEFSVQPAEDNLDSGNASAGKAKGSVYYDEPDTEGDAGSWRIYPPAKSNAGLKALADLDITSYPSKYSFKNWYSDAELTKAVGSYQKTATMTIGSSLSLSAKALPANIAKAAGGTISWSVDKTGEGYGVSVNEKGKTAKISTVGEGVCELKAVDPEADPNKASAAVSILVTNPAKSLAWGSALNFDGKVLTLKQPAGGSSGTATAPPMTATYSTRGARVIPPELVLWSSGNTKLATVDEKGIITAKTGASGKCTIKGVYGGRSVGFTLEVTK